MSSSEKNSVAPSSEFQENLEDLQAIVAAVKQKDASLAADLARDHVRRFNRYMEKKKR